MRKAVLAVLVSLFAASPAWAGQWYEGGTLQKSTLAEWAKAAPENRLATAGDFIAALGSISDLSLIKNTVDMARIRRQAEELVKCIDQTAAKEGAEPTQNVADLVVMCTILKPHQEQ